jgi:acyl-CoA thioesterase FadM
MAYAVFMTGHKGVTARMETRYRTAAQRGESLVVEGWIERDHPRLVQTAARVMRGDDVIAEAGGKFMKLGPLDLESILE